MAFLESLLHGFFTGIGFVLGLILCGLGIILRVAKQKKSKNKDWDKTKLLNAFRKYHTVLMDEENYRCLVEVANIIDSLQDGEQHEAIDHYNIEKKSELVLREGDEGDQIFNIVERYIIKGRKY